jgi:hypothetical protein
VAFHPNFHPGRGFQDRFKNSGVFLEAGPSRSGEIRFHIVKINRFQKPGSRGPNPSHIDGRNQRGLNGLFGNGGDGFWSRRFGGRAFGFRAPVRANPKGAKSMPGKRNFFMKFIGDLLVLFLI